MVLLPLVASLCVMNSCHKEVFTTKGALSFSSDTLTFDTVFTTLGSTTRFFKVRNTQSSAINISDIKLMQLQGTQFRINVDGISGTEFKNVEIPAHDSIYVFVEVTINPNNANNPFVIFDQVQFLTNGTTQHVVLEAMGQNAYYHFTEHIRTSITWPNDKPHIIINKRDSFPLLSIEQGATLNIQPHTQIFMAPGSVITVDGTLNASANSWADSIRFHYFRLEADYLDKPGQWLGITYSRSATINMDHVIIDQSTFGLSDEYVLDFIYNAQITSSDIRNYGSGPKPNITLDKCIIRNGSSGAMLALGTNLTLTNCLFHSTGGNTAVFGVGGNYNVKNCTFANVNNPYTDHKSATLAITDQTTYLNGSVGVGPFPTSAVIQNCAVVGTLNNEVIAGTQSGTLSTSFQNCLLSMNADTFHVIQAADNGCLYIGDARQNNPRIFKNYLINDYMPDSLTSPLSGKGTMNGLPLDLYDYTRNLSNPSIGAIEWHH